MFNHIKKLVEETKNISITYSAAYAQDGKPDIGVRKEGNDCVLIDGVCWLIYGDIYNKTYNTRINDISTMSWYRANGMCVELWAQALIAGQIVQVNLGRRDIITMSNIANQGGTMVLSERK